MNLANHFLIAMPALQDPNFARTVTYLFAHDEDGAMGLVINRPIGLDLGTVLDHAGIGAGAGEDADGAGGSGSGNGSGGSGGADPGDAVRNLPVMEGGPVMKERGFVLHRPRGDWEHTLAVEGEDIAVAMSRDILDAIASGRGPADVLVALGYAGWGPGQLEHEVLQNAWLSGPADPEVMFEAPPGERWKLAAEKLGVDLHRLSGEAGRA